MLFSLEQRRAREAAAQPVAEKRRGGRRGRLRATGVEVEAQEQRPRVAGGGASAHSSEKLPCGGQEGAPRQRERCADLAGRPAGVPGQRNRRC